VSKLKNFKHFQNRPTGCGEIAYCSLEVFFLSHLVYSTVYVGLKVSNKVFKNIFEETALNFGLKFMVFI